MGLFARRGFWRAAASALALLATPAARAQDSLLPLPERRGAAPALPDRAPLPPAAAPAPAVPAARAQPLPPSGAPLFVLRALRLEGSTQLGAAEAEEVARPFLGQPIGLVEVEAMRRAASLLYAQRGFVNSGFVVPEQDVADGVLALRAVEGRVQRVDVSGTRMLRADWMRARIGHGLTVPFDMGALGRQQQILLRDPFLTRLNLSVQPGDAPGEAVLAAEVSEARPFRAWVGLTNAVPSATGGVRANVQGAATSLLGIGDVLAIQYGRTAGVDEGGLAWSVPVWPDDTRLNLRFDRNAAGVVDPALRPLNIASRYDGASIGISRPFLRSPEGALSFGAALDWRQSRTKLLGEPFSFSPGAVDGRTRIAALRLTTDWLSQGAEQVIAARSTLSIGLDALGATNGEAKPNARFVAWLGQGQYVRRLPLNAELLARASLQLAADPLFTLEQFPLGGMATVRGYRENRLITDNAAAATLELRLPLGRVTLPFVEAAPGTGLLQIAPFLDAGHGWNTGRPSPERRDLASAGLALRWAPGPSSLFEVAWGYPLIGRERGNALQERGVSFRFVLGVI